MLQRVSEAPRLPGMVEERRGAQRVAQAGRTRSERGGIGRELRRTRELAAVVRLAEFFVRRAFGFLVLLGVCHNSPRV